MSRVGVTLFVTHTDRSLQSIRNLCSAFSYCLSLLDTLYVWHGCGSVDNERAAARDYAKALATSSSNVVELIEGQSDADDEMFWMILGEGDYARADYWKWRASSLSIHPRVWSVDVTRGADAVRTPCDLVTLLSNLVAQIQPVSFFADHPEFHDLVHLVDCVWEFFVVVGSEARGKRADIRLALTAATVQTTVCLQESGRSLTSCIEAVRADSLVAPVCTDGACVNLAFSTAH